MSCEIGTLFKMVGNLHIIHGGTHTIQGIFHPYPSTLDGAASAMPQGWKTLKSRGPMEKRPHWTAESVYEKITILATDDEIYDRYLLAKRCVNTSTKSHRKTTKCRKKL
jgi:hypothetical protein